MLLIQANLTDGTGSGALAGNGATSGIGALTGRGDAAVGLSGRGATTATGQIVASAPMASEAVLVGAASAISLGALSVQGAAAVLLAGRSSAGATGTLLARGGANTFLAGTNSSASSTGSVSARGEARAPLTGETATTATADLTADGGGYLVSGARAGLIYQLALLHGLDVDHPLTVTPTTRTAGGLSQAVAGTSTVTVSTTAAPVFTGNLDDWIDALADMHGLTTPLVVTATSRAAGAWSQSIVSAGGSTTVARL